MRPLIIVAGLMLGVVAPATHADASVPCPDAIKTEARPQVDRCRAEYVDILTADNLWETLNEGQTMCFRPQQALWKWKCQGYTEAARCRGLRAKDGNRVHVQARLDNNQVTWTCYSP